mmetsp:Transcript_2415/g.3300  ORF Transcript_2415/g.3300 Transcript_2415/m.3300 type:complete len:83 (-) Transcript_2415:1227-1475(-)
MKLSCLRCVSLKFTINSYLPDQQMNNLLIKNGKMEENLFTTSFLFSQVATLSQCLEALQQQIYRTVCAIVLLQKFILLSTLP